MTKSSVLKRKCILYKQCRDVTKYIYSITILKYKFEVLLLDFTSISYYFTHLFH